MDSTAMVGQMISLNQLDQLISINQALTGSTSSGTTGSLHPAAVPVSPANGGAVNTLSPSVAGAVAGQLPFDPNTLMPLNPAMPAVPGAPSNSFINPVTLGTSSSNNISGGK
jgi:hypothetical protein